jgi:predicted nucleic acid-binding protein
VTFVDTAAWFALYVPADPFHAAACQRLAANRPPLLTTDYVIDETLTLIRARGQNRIAIDFGATAFAGTAATVHYLTPDDIAAAWRVFHDFDDKGWSFTDCTSKVVMDRFGVATAFTFDHHFRQFGTVTAVP